MIPAYFWFIPYFVKGLSIENTQISKSADETEMNIIKVAVWANRANKIEINQ